MSKRSESEVIRNVRELVRLPALRVRTEVLVEEENLGYVCVGNFSLPVRQAIEWPYANVWMPLHVHTYLLQKRADVFADIAHAAAGVLEDAVSVHRDRLPGNYLYVLTEARNLRGRGVLRSRTTRYVDAVIELRTISGVTIPRLFHLSPRDRNQGRKQLWP